LEFVTVTHAIKVNESSKHYEKEDVITFQGMIDRENMVLRKIQEEFQL